MGRPFDKHIDNQELDALVPSSSESGQDLHRLSPDAIREAARHVESCGECSRKVSKYRCLMDRPSNEVISQAAAPGANCPKDEDVDWHEVAAGLWPELKGNAADHACRSLRALRPPASRCYVCERRPDSSGRKTAGGTEGAISAQDNRQARTNTIQQASVRLETVSTVECACTSGSVGLDCRSGKYDTAVITGATFRAGVCQVRHKHSQAACSGKSCARRSLGLAADAQ